MDLSLDSSMGADTARAQTLLLRRAKLQEERGAGGAPMGGMPMGYAPSPRGMPMGGGMPAESEALKAVRTKQNEIRMLIEEMKMAKVAMEDKDWKGPVLRYTTGARKWAERYLWCEDGSMQLYKSDVSDRPTSTITLEHFRDVTITELQITTRYDSFILNADADSPSQVFQEFACCLAQYVPFNVPGLDQMTPLKEWTGMVNKVGNNLGRSNARLVKLSPHSIDYYRNKYPQPNEKPSRQDPLNMITNVEVVGLKIRSSYEADEWVLRPTAKGLDSWRDFVGILCEVARGARQNTANIGRAQATIESVTRLLEGESAGPAASRRSILPPEVGGTARGRRAYFAMPVPVGETHTCVLNRRKDNTGMYVDISIEKDGLTEFLMTAKMTKGGGKNAKNWDIVLDKKVVARPHPLYLGVLRQTPFNESGVEMDKYHQAFEIFDDGPDEATMRSLKGQLDQAKKQQAMGQMTPGDYARTFEQYQEMTAQTRLARIDFTDDAQNQMPVEVGVALEPLEVVESESGAFDMRDTGEALSMKSKTPEWEAEFQSWHAPPSDVVRFPDKNNFQVIPADTTDELQWTAPAAFEMGKWDSPDIYKIKVCAPFSLLSGFCTAVSAMERHA